MHLKRAPTPTTRAAEIFRRMAALRNDYVGEKEYFRMTDLWEHVEDNLLVRIRPFESRPNEVTKRKASAIRFGKQVTLIVDNEFWLLAKRGENFPNFVLAHEFSHIELNHHANSAGSKNFELTARETDFANIPPNEQEFEANFAATVLQCGNVLLDSKTDPKLLAQRAFSDYRWVEKAAQLCRLEIFQKEIHKPRACLGRVIF